MKAKDCLRSLYSNLPLKDRSRNETFYCYIKTVLDDFISELKNVEEDELSPILNSVCTFNHFKAPYTKQRFINLMNKVCVDFLDILQLCYKGDFYNAHRLLDKVLNTQRYRLYLTEEYRNYFNFKDPNQKFFRMRDADEFDKDGNPIILDNCWHVPYDMRHIADSGRYSLLGSPCLYLASSLKTSDAELGDLQKGRVRWVGSFIYKGRSLVYDFRLPTVDELETVLHYDQFVMLLQYPLLAMCYCVSRGNSFNEEYYIPQLLFHHILVNKNNGIQFDGIAYTSTKDREGFNIAFPARYNQEVPPSDGYSDYLMDVFTVTKPIIYRKG